MRSKQSDENHKFQGVFIQPNKKSQTQANARYVLNNNIPYSKMLLLDEDGQKIGIKTKDEALNIAAEKRKDLVLISVVKGKPIVRILDYGKYKYNKKKKEKELKEKQTIISNRQIRLTPLINDHDLETKARKAKELLIKGDRVKVSLKFKGRELSRQEIGHEKLEKFFKLVEDVAKIDKQPHLQAKRFLDMILHPDKVKIQKYKRELESSQQV